MSISRASLNFIRLNVFLRERVFENSQFKYRRVSNWCKSIEKRVEESTVRSYAARKKKICVLR